MIAGFCADSASINSSGSGTLARTRRWAPSRWMEPPWALTVSHELHGVHWITALPRRHPSEVANSASTSIGSTIWPEAKFTPTLDPVDWSGYAMDGYRPPIAVFLLDDHTDVGEVAREMP